MRIALLLAPVTMIVVFVLWPLATLAGRALSTPESSGIPGGTTWTETLARNWPEIARVLWFTTWQAVVSTVVTVVVGLVPAGVIATYRFAGRGLLLGALTAVFVLPTVVVATAFIAVLPATFERSIWAILGAHFVFNLAVVVRVVASAWQGVPASLSQAAATLGASPLQVLVRVTLVVLRPAIVAAASIVFLFCFTSFGVIRLLGGPGRATIEVEIWRQATQIGDLGTAAMLTIVQLGLLAVVIGWAARYQRRHGVTLRLQPVVPDRRARTHRERIAVAATALATGAVIAVPLVGMLERSLRAGDGYGLAAWRTLGRSEVRPGIGLGFDMRSALVASLSTAVIATVMAVAIGTLAALAIEAAGRGAKTLDIGLMLPLGTSAVTIGFGMLITFSRPPVDWRAAWWLVPLGHALIAVPFVVRTMLSELRARDPRLGEAAATLGAGPLRAWWHTIGPLLWRPLALSASLAAAISLGEFGATSFLSRTGSETVPIIIERLVGRSGSLLQAQAFALATILAAATVTVVLVIDHGLARPRRRR